MKEFIEYIGTYNLFNYLFPGVIFSVIVEESTSFILLPDNMLLVAFICYFIGMIISRIGSIIIEPILKKLHFIKFKEYKDYVKASKKDSKLDILSEQNNTYRTIVSMILMSGLVKFYELFIRQFPFLAKFNFYIILLTLLILFLFTYKKQTSFINKRIKKNFKQK
jgi:hypothetical protein